jgi:phenylacetate-CoA ligase
LRLLDIARSAYVKSPPGLRRSVAPFISMMPLSLRYGAVYERWRRDIARARTDLDFSTTTTTKTLRALIEMAAQASPFHSARFKAALGRDFDIRSVEVEDLMSLPILTKAELRSAGEAALTVPARKLARNCTSGSNGEEPFAFYVDRDRSVREFAFVNDAWTRAGYTRTEARCVLKGFRMKGAEDRLCEWEPALNELRLCVFPMSRADVAHYIDLIDARGIRFLHGYPSAIEVLSRHMLALRRSFKLPIKGILPISEPLYDHQRAVIREALGHVAFAPFYGLSEKALFAREISEDVYEFEPLYGLAELVDDAGAPIVTPGMEGRLVGTGLISSGMPFIRYDTEDRATLVEAGTRANGWRMKVETIRPRRKPGFFIGRAGNRIIATNFPPQDPAFFRGIGEFQFVQCEPGKAVIRYVAAEGGSEGDAERIRAALEAKADGHMAFTLERVQCLASGSQGKRAFIDQQLDLARY